MAKRRTIAASANPSPVSGGEVGAVEPRATIVAESTLTGAPHHRSQESSGGPVTPVDGAAARLLCDSSAKALGAEICPQRRQSLHRSDPATPAQPPGARTISFDIEHWDDGRLLVNGRFAELLKANGLTSFESLFNHSDGEIVRQLDNRATSRIVLRGQRSEEAVFLKRHERASLAQRARPLLRGSLPTLGARREWDAILRFHAAGLPTMTPVAFGESEGRSLVMTQDLHAKGTLLAWVNETFAGAGAETSASPATITSLVRRLAEQIAEIARRMHDCGMHHQDFYLNHLLYCGAIEEFDIRVIDLGRVRQPRRLARRWIIKDLAQLDFSARRLGCSQRLRFLRLYLGRPFRPEDRRLVRRIAAKSRRIAAHTARHGL